MRLALALAFLVAAAAPATLGTAQTRGGYLAGQPPIDAVRLLPPPLMQP